MDEYTLELVIGHATLEQMDELLDVIIQTVEKWGGHTSGGWKPVDTEVTDEQEDSCPV
jgi:hypothetical protein